MDVRFKEFIDNLHVKYEYLISMKPVTIYSLPENIPKGGVYLFLENGIALYAGRTKRKISNRLKKKELPGSLLIIILAYYKSIPRG